MGGMARPPISPVRWQPPPAPPRSRQPRSERPLPPLRLLDVVGRGPEDVLVDDSGRVLTGMADGRVLRLAPDNRRVEVLADTGGRPLGLEWLPDGAVLVCDARRGLLRVDPESGAVDELVSEVDGEAMRFCNNAAVAPDGTVYFSDSSRRFGVDHWKADLYEHTGTGRLFRRGLSAEVTLLADGLQFANGVALAPDGSFVVVAESAAYRLRRVWITGPRAGEVDVFVDNLPGFPDNVSTGTDGLFWVAMGSPRDAKLDRLLPRHPLLRQVAWRLPDRVQPRPATSVWAYALSPDGEVVHDLQAPGGRFHFVTGVREHHGTVHLGSLTGDCVALFDLAS
jgi:sugar lactone lactonase YvrE